MKTNRWQALRRLPHCCSLFKYLCKFWYIRVLCFIVNALLLCAVRFHFLFRVKDALDRKPSFQTQYQLVFVVWVMTLDSSIARTVSRYRI